LLLVAVLAASLVVERPWCRWLCPLGALQGLISRLSPWTIRRDSAACTLCRRCDRACPMGIPVSQLDAVRSERCNRCTACVEACPQQGALAYSGRPGRRSLRRAAAAAAVLAVFSLPLLVAGATGWYRPPGRPPGLLGTLATPAAPTAPATAAAPTTAGGQRPFDPDTLSPRMSLAETAAGLGMEPGELLELLGLDPRFDPSTALFDIEENPDYEEVTFGYVRRVLEAHFGSRDS